MNNRYHVIIVGSGPAGLAAADILSRYGLRILIIDDNAHTGGQLLRRLPHAVDVGRRFDPDKFKRRGMQLVARLKNRKVRFLNGSQVLGVFPQQILLVEAPGGHVSEYRTEAMILATGARERQLPFKGWTLPGVMATGAAQILMKSSGILPGKKTLIAGCGPLMLVLAAEILANRGEVLAVLDQGPMTGKLRAATAGPAIWPRLFEGAICLARLAASRVPMKQGIRIVEATGRHHLESVVAARVDARGRIVQGTEQPYSTDTLAVGYGFTPNTELPQQAGCAVSYAVDRGGWYVDVNACMATTVANTYAVGETTGIAGASKSLLEGRIAAWSFLYRQGRVDRRTYKIQTRPLIRRRSQQIRYGRFLNRLWDLSPDCYADIPDETTVCRCEEITMGEIRRHMRIGFTTMNGIKKATRCGMGNCQGRICGPILLDILSTSGQQSPAAIGCTSVRAPVKPVVLGALAEMAPVCSKGSEEPAVESGKDLMT